MPFPSHRLRIRMQRHGPEHKQENAGQQNCQQHFYPPHILQCQKDIFRCPFATTCLPCMFPCLFVFISLWMLSNPIHLLPYLPSAPQNAPGFPYAFHRTGTGPPSSSMPVSYPRSSPFQGRLDGLYAVLLVNLCQHLEILVTAEQPLYKVLGRVCILCILKCRHSLRNPWNTVRRVAMVDCIILV